MAGLFMLDRPEDSSRSGRHCCYYYLLLSRDLRSRESARSRRRGRESAGSTDKEKEGISGERVPSIPYRRELLSRPEPLESDHVPPRSIFFGLLAAERNRGALFPLSSAGSLAVQIFHLDCVVVASLDPTLLLPFSPSYRYHDTRTSFIKTRRFIIKLMRRN